MEFFLKCFIVATCIFSMFTRSNLRSVMLCMIASLMVSCYFFVYTNMKILGILVMLSYIALFLAIFIVNCINRFTEIKYIKKCICTCIGVSFSLIITRLVSKNNICSHYIQNIDELYDICSQNTGIYFILSLILFLGLVSVLYAARDENKIPLLHVNKANTMAEKANLSVMLVDIQDNKNV